MACPQWLSQVDFGSLNFFPRARWRLSKEAPPLHITWATDLPGNTSPTLRGHVPSSFCEMSEHLIISTLQISIIDQLFREGKTEWWSLINNPSRILQTFPPFLPHQQGDIDFTIIDIFPILKYFLRFCWIPMNALRLIRIVPEIILERNYFYWALIIDIFAEQYWHLDLWTAERSFHGMEEKRRLYLLYCYIDIFARQYWHLDLWTAERSFHGMEEKRRQRQSLTQSEEIRAGGRTLGPDLGLGLGLGSETETLRLDNCLFCRKDFGLQDSSKCFLWPGQLDSIKRHNAIIGAGVQL